MRQVKQCPSQFSDGPPSKSQLLESRIRQKVHEALQELLKHARHSLHATKPKSHNYCMCKVRSTYVPRHVSVPRRVWVYITHCHTAGQGAKSRSDSTWSAHDRLPIFQLLFNTELMGVLTCFMAVSGFLYFHNSITSPLAIILQLQTQRISLYHRGQYKVFPDTQLSHKHHFSTVASRVDN